MILANIDVIAICLLAIGSLRSILSAAKILFDGKEHKENIKKEKPFYIISFIGYLILMISHIFSII
jgi:hypothetical protein